ncbi:MAG: universal stress protein [Chloroflexota bacterium]
MYERIVVPLDGSTLAESVLPYVEALVKGGGATLLLVQVNESDIGGESPAHQQLLNKMSEQRTTFGRAYLTHIARRLKDRGIQATGELLQGRVAGAVAKYAVEQKADLVAMSTHGRTGLARWRYGSVANELRQMLPLPLLLLHAEEEQSEAYATAMAQQMEDVVVPLDGSPIAEQALPHAVELAKRLNVDIHIVRVVMRPYMAYAEPNAVEYYFELDTEMTNVANEYLQEVRKRLEAEGVRVTTRVFHGLAAENLVDYADALGNSLVCMTTHGRTGLGRVVLGSVADKVLHDTTRPVFLIRAQ